MTHVITDYIINIAPGPIIVIKSQTIIIVITIKDQGQSNVLPVVLPTLIWLSNQGKFCEVFIYSVSNTLIHVHYYITVTITSRECCLP